MRQKPRKYLGLMKDFSVSEASELCGKGCFGCFISQKKAGKAKVTASQLQVLESEQQLLVVQAMYFTGVFGHFQAEASLPGSLALSGSSHQIALSSNTESSQEFHFNFSMLL